MIYLDNAATTFPKPEKVYQIMDKVNREMAVNAGRGSYKLARQATKLIDDAKKKILKLVQVNNDARVIFTPSITIALNQIIYGIEWKKGDVVYVSPYEHNAVARPLYQIQKKFCVIIKEIPIDDKTLEVDIESLKYEFSKNRPKAIFCTHVSNVTGYILPVKEIFKEGKRYKSINVLDSAQSLGLIPIDSRELAVDIIAFAGHKTLYGPFGIGGFINLTGIDLAEVLAGGTGSDSLNLDMPQNSSLKYEMASSNIVAIAGLNAAIDDLDIESIYEHEKELTEYLIEEIKKVPGITLYLPDNINEQVGIVSFNLEGYSAEELGVILDEDFDIAVRTGYHCAPYIHKWLKDERKLGTVRIGIGRYTNKEEIHDLIIAINDILMG